MLYWALVFFIIAIIAGLFGFTGISIAFAEIAKLLFFIFVVLFVIAIVLSVFGYGFSRRGPPPPL